MLVERPYLSGELCIAVSLIGGYGEGDDGMVVRLSFFFF